MDTNTTQIMRSDDLRSENRHRILRTLRKDGPMSRAKVAANTGLSHASLSNLLGLMTDEGIVTSSSLSSTKNKPGRPQTTVTLNEHACIAITVSLAVDSITVCTINYSGKTIEQKHFTVDSTALSLKQLNKLVINGIESAVSAQPKSQLKAISVGFQGVTDSQAGELLWSPILSIDRVPIASTLKKQFNVPVSVNNDCGLIASALHSKQHKTLGSSFAAILFSHGIGMGLYLSGQPFTGAHSSALELGHVQFKENGAKCRCGKLGCIEAYAADYGILRSASQDTGDVQGIGKITDKQFQSLIDDASNGDTNAVNAFKLAGQAIGAGLATVFTLLDPMPVALVGHNADAVNLMSNEIRAALKAVGRNPTDWSHLLHCYNDDTPMLLDGLILDVMSLVDREFAMNSDTTESSPA